MNRIATAAVAALAGLAVLTPAAANAAGESVSDAKRDALRTSRTTSTPVHDAPLNRTADITRMTTRHGPERIVLEASMRDVTAGRFWAYFTVKTSEGTTATGVFWRDRERGRMVESAAFGDEQDVQCPVNARLDQRNDTIRMAVPRSCLGDPDWIRTGLTTFAFNDRTVYYDDARRDGESARNTSKLGPRVYAG